MLILFHIKNLCPPTPQKNPQTKTKQPQTGDSTALSEKHTFEE